MGQKLFFTVTWGCGYSKCLSKKKKKNKQPTFVLEFFKSDYLERKYGAEMHFSEELGVGT